MKVLFFISILLLASSCTDKQDKILPTEQALMESVYASATVQPDSLYQVYTVVSVILDVDFANKTDRIIQMGDGRIIG